MVQENAFFAMADRTRYIQRWSLMRNAQEENLAEHSFLVAVIAHGLALIRQTHFPDLKPQVSAEKVLGMALYHDLSEVITGDLPTPVKYQEEDLTKAYKRIEDLAVKDLLNSLPEDLRPSYEALLNPEADSEEVLVMLKLVKAADKLSALAKCMSELKQGNQEFQEAQEATLKRLEELAMPEVELFLRDFMPAFSLSLDELRENKVIK